jgi:hypothetical protein
VRELAEDVGHGDVSCQVQRVQQCRPYKGPLQRGAPQSERPRGEAKRGGAGGGGTVHRA